MTTRKMPEAIQKIAAELVVTEAGDLRLPVPRIEAWARELKNAPAEDEMGTMLVVFAMRLAKQCADKAVGDLLLIAAEVMGHGGVVDALQKAGASTKQVQDLAGRTRTATAQKAMTSPGTAGGISVRSNRTK